jgi:hypothetical protein
MMSWPARVTEPANVLPLRLPAGTPNGIRTDPFWVALPVWMWESVTLLPVGGSMLVRSRSQETVLLSLLRVSVPTAEPLGSPPPDVPVAASFAPVMFTL